jgi:hypothetical protein
MAEYPEGWLPKDQTDAENYMEYLRNLPDDDAGDPATVEACRVILRRYGTGSRGSRS